MVQTGIAFTHARSVMDARGTVGSVMKRRKMADNGRDDDFGLFTHPHSSGILTITPTRSKPSEGIILESVCV
jgi:hypothetical protein